jgi:hypothetical protein
MGDDCRIVHVCGRGQLPQLFQCVQGSSSANAPFAKDGHSVPWAICSYRARQCHAYSGAAFVLCHEVYPQVGSSPFAIGTNVLNPIQQVADRADYQGICAEARGHSRILYPSYDATRVSGNLAAILSGLLYSWEHSRITAWSDRCSSWFKNGTTDGPITALHPGSRIHFFEMLQIPRYEDYDFTYTGNR